MKVTLILGVLVVLITAAAAAQPDLEEGATKVTQNLEQDRAELVAAPILEPKGASGSAWYIVQLQDEPLATYRGEVAGLAATNPAARGEVKLDTQSRASQAYLAYLETQQAAFLTEVEQSLARSVVVAHQYSYAFNGVALELTAEEAAMVAKLPNVRQLQRNFYRQLLTDYGPEWIGADNIWNGTALGGPENRGEGIIVGVIDSGINMDHPSFADVGGDGYDHDNPLGAGNYVGWCDPDHSDSDTRLGCHDKVRGVCSYAATGADP
jgi:subtilisin family serine protease